MKAEYDSPFSEHLRRHRMLRGLTQEELAEKAGLSPRGIRALERGERTAPRRDTVELLADALELTGEERSTFQAAARGGLSPGVEPKPRAQASISEPQPTGSPAVQTEHRRVRAKRSALFLVVVLGFSLIGRLLWQALASDASGTRGPIGAPVPRWGEDGERVSALVRPQAVTVSRSGEVYVLDGGDSRIHEFTADGVPLREWGGPGTARGRFLSPSALAVDDNGNVYVADTDNNRIQVFSSLGRWRASWTGQSIGSLNLPSGIMVGQDGHIYVSDTGNHRVDVFLPTGRLLEVWQPPGLYLPSLIAGERAGDLFLLDGAVITELSNGGISTQRNALVSDVTGLAIDPHGNVCESSGDSVVCFDLSGRLLRTISTRDTRDVQGIAFDGQGYLYVASAKLKGIVKLSSTGRLVSYIDGTPPSAHARQNPGAVATDMHGRVYVALPGGRINVYSPAGVLLDGWTVPGASLESNPRGIAVDRRGNLVLTDSAANRLWRLNSDGVVVGQWSGRFDLPVGVAVDGQGNMYVADAGASRIDKLTPSGRLVHRWDLTRYTAQALPGPSPYGVAVDPDGSVYVADGLLDTIWKLSPTGKLVANWGRMGSRPGQFRSPGALALGDNGDLFVVDGENSRVQVLSPSGKVLQVIGRTGRRVGELSRPSGIAVDRWGYVYVADTGNSRVQKFRPG